MGDMLAVPESPLLQDHQRHPDMKPWFVYVYMCQHCGEEFSSRDLLHTHVADCTHVDNPILPSLPLTPESDTSEGNMTRPVTTPATSLLSQADLTPVKRFTRTGLTPLKSLTQTTNKTSEENSSSTFLCERLEAESSVFNSTPKKQRPSSVMIPSPFSQNNSRVPKAKFLSGLGLLPLQKARRISSRRRSTYCESLDLDEDVLLSPTKPQTPKSLISHLSREDSNPGAATPTRRKCLFSTSSTKSDKDDDSDKSAAGEKLTLVKSLFNIAITSPLGQCVVKHYKSDPSLHILSDIESHCITERSTAEDETCRLRARTNTYPIVFRGYVRNRDAVYIHKYKFNRQEKKEFLRYVSTGLDRRSRILSRSMKRCSVRLIHLAKADLKRWIPSYNLVTVDLQPLTSAEIKFWITPRAPPQHNINNNDDNQPASFPSGLKLSSPELGGVLGLRTKRNSSPLSVSNFVSEEVSAEVVKSRRAILKTVLFDSIGADALELEPQVSLKRPNSESKQDRHTKDSKGEYPTLRNLLVSPSTLPDITNLRGLCSSAHPNKKLTGSPAKDLENSRPSGARNSRKRRLSSVQSGTPENKPLVVAKNSKTLKNVVSASGANKGKLLVVDSSNNGKSLTASKSSVAVNVLGSAKSSTKSIKQSTTADNFIAGRSLNVSEKGSVLTKSSASEKHSTKVNNAVTSPSAKFLTNVQPLAKPKAKGPSNVKQVKTKSCCDTNKKNSSAMKSPNTVTPAGNIISSVTVSKSSSNKSNLATKKASAKTSTSAKNLNVVAILNVVKNSTAKKNTNSAKQSAPENNSAAKIISLSLKPEKKERTLNSSSIVKNSQCPASASSNNWKNSGQRLQVPVPRSPKTRTKKCSHRLSAVPSTTIREAEEGDTIVSLFSQPQTDNNTLSSEATIHLTPATSGPKQEDTVSDSSPRVVLRARRLKQCSSVSSVASSTSNSQQVEDKQTICVNNGDTELKDEDENIFLKAAKWGLSTVSSSFKGYFQKTHSNPPIRKSPKVFSLNVKSTKGSSSTKSTQKLAKAALVKCKRGSPTKLAQKLAKAGLVLRIPCEKNCNITRTDSQLGKTKSSDPSRSSLRKASSNTRSPCVATKVPDGRIHKTTTDLPLKSAFSSDEIVRKVRTPNPKLKSRAKSLTKLFLSRENPSRTLRALKSEQVN